METKIPQLSFLIAFFENFVTSLVPLEKLNHKNIKPRLQTITVEYFLELIDLLCFQKMG